MAYVKQLLSKMNILIKTCYDRSKDFLQSDHTCQGILWSWKLLEFERK